MACWLCKGLGAVAVHNKATEEYGITLWVAHSVASTSHPVNVCPVCTKKPVLMEQLFYG